ncbi:inclusion body protein [Pandoraea terrae]|uniref:Inclusion body protein n=1 Tax=Pandoraea terrae TaxID=1537710 RepID=A0A5E4Z598_9BURK|nr:AidA/PixA family protein [Pandoraea terrae]VVE55520.1 inclusion body protein [Pandoraea terrae]
MSSTQSCSRDSAQIVDVLLAVDVLTLLARYPGASRDPGMPTPVDGEASFVLAPSMQGIEADRAGRLRVCAAAGAKLRLRATALALRGEHAVLLSEVRQPQDSRSLSSPSSEVDAHAEIGVPQAQHPERPLRRPAVDHFWQMSVLGQGRGEFRVGIMLTGRDGVPLGCFRFSLAYEISE